jgi:hypothetical protein
MEPVPETLYLLNHLTRLMAREDYIKSCRRESFKTYTIPFMYHRHVSMDCVCQCRPPVRPPHPHRTPVI